MKLENNLAIVIWLWCIAALIFAMVIVGGATRLTDSGLSITEWKPLLGAIPPLNGADWSAAFQKYQQIPEYKIQNAWMSLADFKSIYWWEWAHRFLGRFIGIAFLLPLIFFAVTKRVKRKFVPWLVFLFVMGGAQGALGWYMVSSGLSERVDVSQYRLAAHLTLAVALFAAVVWTALMLQRPSIIQKGRGMALVFLGLLFVQITAGGFVAGLDAGFVSDTWPLMDGALVPAGLDSLQPFWRNLFENSLAVQFNHRLLAYLLLILAIAQFIRMRNKTSLVVLLAVLAQMTLGILTVVNQVRFDLALFHQGGALLVVTAALWHLARGTASKIPTRPPPPALRATSSPMKNRVGG